MIKRIIPSTGEEIPVIGLGTWKTFDVTAEASKQPLREVLKQMIGHGSSLIDTSPMYGYAESVIGELTESADLKDNLFYATKVWIDGRKAGIRQMNESLHRMRRTTIDLMQIHNLKDWKVQLQTLREWKAEGKVRYLGITHYTDAMHSELERIISTEKIDFVQFNYSIFSRNAEKRLFSAAVDNGVATLINRPFGEGGDSSKTKNIPLPAWVEEYNIKTWSQFLLLYIISNPDVTVVIPATVDPQHAEQNFALANSKLPDQDFRAKMLAYISSL
jgi:diketogulonate reductase-like aldo/keto reductase